MAADAPSNPPPMYAELEEWADVTPVPQYEGVQPLAPIFYTPEYKDATDYLRGVLASGELSPRVLALTERVIRLNPAHYTAWQLRYKTLLAIDASLPDELVVTNELSIKHLKTYQVWHHRRLLLTKLNDPTNELPFVAKVLETDHKNYHTWSHRQWVLAHFDRPDLWEGELPFIEKMLEEDVRNNSAWHHRFFTVFERSGADTGEDVVRRELSFTKEKIALAPNNASAWNYLRGILDHTSTPYVTLTDFVLPYTSATAPVSFSPSGDDGAVLDLENPPPSKGSSLPAIPALDFIADVYETEGEVQKAVPIWHSLADEHDTIRKKYWEHRIREATAVTAA
ncbi:protein prenylyltransferase [Peniophora sp. CONT]|nr:protein prenylyltransferase [Peniophora sp. CONT]